MRVRLVENQQLIDGTMRLPSQVRGTDSTMTVRYAGCTKAVKALPLTPVPGRMVTSVMTEPESTEALVQLSSKLRRELKLPKEARLRIKRQGNLLRLGPCVGFYVQVFTGNPRRFGEQTQLLADLTQIGFSRGMDVIIYVPGTLTSGRGFRYDLQAKKFVPAIVPIPDVMYRRSGGFGASEKIAAKELAVLKDKGILLTLPRVCSNKWYLYQLFKRDSHLSPHLPYTHLVNSPDEILKQLRLRKDIYVKPIAGSQGISIYHLVMTAQGHGVVTWEEPRKPIGLMKKNNSSITEREIQVWKFTRDDDFQSFWAQTRLKRCLVQDTVNLPKTNDDRPFDFRWLVQATDKGPVVTARVARLGRSHAVTTNIHTGGRPIQAEDALKAASIRNVENVLDELDNVSLHAYHALESTFGSFGEVGIDLALRPDGTIVVFEVNPTPGRRMLRSFDGQAREMSLARLLEYASFATGFDDGT